MNLVLNALDYIFIILILIASVRGALRGFIDELLSMAAIILSLASAVLFSRILANKLSGLWGESFWNQVIAFLLIFIVVYVFVKIIEGLLNRLFEALHLEKLDRALGFLLGVAEGIILVIIVLFVLNWQPLFDTAPLVEGSFFARILLPLLPPPSAVYIPGVG